MTSWVSGTGYDDARRRQGRAATRDEVDWGQLYREYLPRVRSYVRGRVPAAWVEDTAQDTFARAFRSRHRFDDSRPVWPWLVTIARRACIETCRAHPIEVSFDLAVHGGIAADDPHVELERGMQAQAIDGALRLVSSRHRHLLVTYELQGRPFASLAEDEHISRQALKSALCRARESFRTHYSTLAERRGLAALPVVGPLMARLRRWRRAFGVATVPMELASVIVVGVGATALLAGMPAAPQTQAAVVVGAGADGLASAASEATEAPHAGSPDVPVAAPVPVALELRQGSPAAPDDGRRRFLRAEGDADLAVEPDGSTATIRLDWDDPTGPGQWTTTVTLDCQGGAWQLACSSVRAVPGAT